MGVHADFRIALLHAESGQLTGAAKRQVEFGTREMEEAKAAEHREPLPDGRHRFAKAERLRERGPTSGLATPRAACNAAARAILRASSCCWRTGPGKFPDEVRPWPVARSPPPIRPRARHARPRAACRTRPAQGSRPLEMVGQEFGWLAVVSGKRSSRTAAILACSCCRRLLRRLPCSVLNQGMLERRRSRAETRSEDQFRVDQLLQGLPELRFRKRADGLRSGRGGTRGRWRRRPAPRP